jgi:hypothetical protein
MSNDIWGLLPKKRKNSLTIPGKKTTPATSSATSKTTDKTVKVKAVKPKKVKTQFQQNNNHRTNYLISDFKHQWTTLASTSQRHIWVHLFINLLYLSRNIAIGK